MLSIETESRVVKLFVNLFEGEKSVESTRILLADQLQFDAYHIFTTLDRENKNHIDEYNIVDFLKVNSVYCTLAEARIIISFYDSNFDGNLNYSEFLNLILSESDYAQRKIARGRIGYKKTFSLSYDVEFSLVRLLERELDLARAVDLLITDLKARYDYNVLDIYSLIQGYGSYITLENVRRFMIRNDIDITESELNNLFKRLDIDCDSRITFTEFKRLFNCASGISLLSNKNSSLTFSSPLRSSQRSSRTGGFESPRGSPVRINNTVSRVYSPLRDRTMSILNKSIERLDLNRSTMRSPQRTLSPRSPRFTASNGFVERNLSSSLRSNGYISYEEENFISYLRDLLEIENEIEKAKIDLTYKTDFNVEDAFRIFELDGRGYITDIDIKYGLNALDLFASREEIALLIKRYDIQNEGVINFSNFFDMVAPLEREFRRKLENRLPSLCNPRHNKGDNLLPSTRIAFQELLRLLIRSEVKIESMRQRLNRLSRFSIKNIFERIDKLEKNYLLDSDLVTYMNRNDVLFVDKDIDYLFIRMDRDRNGRISYSEFYDEIYPKSREYLN